MNELHMVGNASTLHELDDSYAEHLRVDAKVLVVLQSYQHRVWNTADTCK